MINSGARGLSGTPKKGLYRSTSSLSADAKDGVGSAASSTVDVLLVTMMNSGALGVTAFAGKVSTGDAVISAGNRVDCMGEVTLGMEYSEPVVVVIGCIFCETTGEVSWQDSTRETSFSFIGTERKIGPAEAWWKRKRTTAAR